MFYRNWPRLEKQLAVLTCCLTFSFTAAADGIAMHDANGRDAIVSHSTRIVSIGGAITEILYALGFEGEIVGIDTTSTFPSTALIEKPNVGYMRQLSSEGIVGLNPTLILAMQGSGPKETIDILEAAKIPLVFVPEALSEEGMLDKIKLVGHAMGADKRAACLAEAVSNDLIQLRELRAKITKPLRVMFIMSFLNDKPMAAGRNTAADKIIQLAGGINAIDGYDGYKAIDDESVVKSKPDVALSIARNKDTIEAEKIYAHPAFTLTPVAKNKTFISMDGLYLLGFGPRTAAAARDLLIKFYPSLAPQAEKFVSSALSVICR